MALRLCSYNIRDFDALFTAHDAFAPGDYDGKTTRLEVREAIRDVLLAVDPDVLGVVEAPDTTATGSRRTAAALEAFAVWAGLRARKALVGFVSQGKQELGLLYDPGVVKAKHVPGGSTSSKSNPRFDGELQIDTDDDRVKEVYRFYRPPLEAKLTLQANGRELYLILCHAKSKGIFDAMDVVHWERENRRNRRKLHAECTWIRRRVGEWLGKGRELVVMGDFNDGPEMDYFEAELGRSAVEIVMGDVFEPDALLRNHAGRPSWTRFGWSPATASFRDRLTDTWVNVQIDHILASRGLAVAATKAHRIWDPHHLPEAKPLKRTLWRASDHYPVSLDLDL
jgi:endonuclease/exonuclease/phosphatase family metal-dependent hydrolase